MIKATDTNIFLDKINFRSIIFLCGLSKTVEKQKEDVIIMMKKEYQKPTLEVIRFESEDIITTSDGVGIIPGPGMGGGNEGETGFE